MFYFFILLYLNHFHIVEINPMSLRLVNVPRVPQLLYLHNTAADNGYDFPDEVAIIDEIQMIADRGRGWAWTRAILGLQADEIHLCGEAGAINLIEEICNTTGEELEVFQSKIMWLCGGEALSHTSVESSFSSTILLSP